MLRAQMFRSLIIRSGIKERNIRACYIANDITLISLFYPHFSVLFHFSVVSPFQCFIPISALYPHFSVLSAFLCFIPISALYPMHFSVLSPFQRFIPIPVSVFSFRFSHSVSAFYPDPFVQGHIA